MNIFTKIKLTNDPFGDVMTIADSFLVKHLLMVILFLWTNSLPAQFIIQKDAKISIGENTTIVSFDKNKTIDQEEIIFFVGGEAKMFYSKGTTLINFPENLFSDSDSAEEIKIGTTSTKKITSKRNQLKLAEKKVALNPLPNPIHFKPYQGNECLGAGVYNSTKGVTSNHYAKKHSVVNKFIKIYDGGLKEPKSYFLTARIAVIEYRKAIQGRAPPVV